MPCPIAATAPGVSHRAAAVSAQNASTSGIAARAAAGDLALPRANHANAIATAELLRARASPRPGSDPPDTAQRGRPAPSTPPRVGPSCRDTRHVDRSHSTKT